MAEVELCGHATLASAYLMFKSNLARGSCVFFHTDAATLRVSKIMGGDGEWQGQVELRFPFLDTTPASANMGELLPRTLRGCKVISAHTSTGGRLILELPGASEVETLKPCFEEILAGPGVVVVTGKGRDESPFDFVSRFFAPQYGIPEDPVCGTAHCALAPMWAAKLGKESLLAYQASKRGGVLDLFVDHHSKCVLLRGTAVMVAAGVLLT